ncbi:MAG: hypothetical protein FWC13_07880 [Oscillospiraceae bacterium]|nr:hypothetical protein [Oscillospiraceae bacterium]
MSFDDKNKHSNEHTDSKNTESKTFIQKFISTITTAAAITLIVAAIGAIYSLIAHGELRQNYVLYPNFVVSSLITIVGLVGPRTAGGILGFVKAKVQQFNAVVTNETYTDFMEERKQKRAKGKEFFWIGLTGVLMTGIVEIIVWLIW